MIHRVRRATEADVEAISGLVREFSRPGYLLPRSATEIRDSIDLWFVVGGQDEVIACGSLLPYTERLAEVRSLAVAPEAQGLGLGGAVLTALVGEAERRHFETLFALTRAVPFFERHSFEVSRRMEFPEKVWRDCMGCPFIDNCDEIAVVLRLNGEWDRGREAPGD